MRKTTLLFIWSLIISGFASAQTSSEQFETESAGSTSFTDNGVIFNILSTVATYNVNVIQAGGWNGIVADNRFIDNTGTATPQNANSSLAIKTTSNLFKVNRFWAYLGDANGNLGSAGTVTITGRLSGVTKFTQTKTTGFVTSIGSTNGYTLIDMTNLNGQNYSNIVIDELRITIGGNFRYMKLDTFTWVKDSGIVLASNDVKTFKKETRIYPNPTTGPITINTIENTRFEIYSHAGQLVKTFNAGKGASQADISDLPKGIYILKSASEVHKIIKE